MSPNPTTNIVHASSAEEMTNKKLNSGYLNAAFVESETSKREVALKTEMPKVTNSNNNVSSMTGSTGSIAKSSIDFDDLLPLIGEFGRYQQILFLLMLPFAIFVAFVYFAQIFIAIVPEEHWCRIPELESLTAEQR